MTMLVGWVGVQNDGPASIYVASDSRISWPTAKRRWDAGRKVFALRNSPDLFGFCGDALLPSHILGQLSEVADNGLLFPTAEISSQRHERMIALFAATLAKRTGGPTEEFTLVHAARDDADERSSFSVWSTRFTGSTVRDEHWISIDATSAGQSRRLFALGTGAPAYTDETIRWDSSAQAHTSRAYFTALCDVLARGDDPSSGGPPQLVGLYRRGNGRTIGVIHEGKRTFLGMPISHFEHNRSIEWRDDTFQRIDGRTLVPLAGAQRQVRPRLPPFSGA